jgi:hypothetical protein
VADAPAGASAASITLRDRLLPSPTGVVPNAAILTKLSELSYEGPVTPLPHPSQFKGVTRDKNVKQAAEAMISVWPGAELVEEEAAEAGDAAPPSAAGDAGEANGVPDAEKAPASA